MQRGKIKIITNIDNLIFSIENSDIDKIDKLKVVKVLVSIKLRLIEFLSKNGGWPRSSLNSSVKKANGQNHSSSEKQGLILEFIKGKGGPVDLLELSKLGIAGRSLRRYLRSLAANQKIRIKKSGRRKFYELLTI